VLSYLSKLALPRRTADARGVGPVCVDFGSETIRLVQLAAPDATTGTQRVRRVAAIDVPPFVADEPAAYWQHAGDSLKEAVRAGFVGRRAILNLPTSRQTWLHVRLPKLDASQRTQVVASEVADKLPFDAARAALRHEVVGEVQTADGPRQEVLVVATRAAEAEAALAAAERAGLDAESVVAGPSPLRDGVANFFSRESDPTTTFCFVDLGRRGTRVSITRGGRLYFARDIGQGLHDVDAAVAKATGRSPDEVEADRRLAAQAAPAPTPSPDPAPEGGMAMLAAATRRSEEQPAPDAAVHEAATPVLDQLADEIARCRRHHDASFPEMPVTKLAFVGGGALDTASCRRLAQGVGVAAQIGDFAARVSLAETADTPADFEEGQPRPQWAVALGVAATHIAKAGQTRSTKEAA
jgi:Tfp pilus assembly PilM family ATPase